MTRVSDQKNVNGPQNLRPKRIDISVTTYSTTRQSPVSQFAVHLEICFHVHLTTPAQRSAAAG